MDPEVTSPTESQRAYRDWMRQSLREAMAVVARISLGELEGIPAPELIEHEDEEFADLMAGLSVLAEDTKEAIEEREAQARLTDLRTELWRHASSGFQDEHLFVSVILETTCTALRIASARYYRFVDGSRDAECACEWHVPNFPSSLGLRLPPGEWQPHLAHGKSGVDWNVADDDRSPGPEPAVIRSALVSTIGVRCGPERQPTGLILLSAHDPRAWPNSERAILQEVAHIITGKLVQMAAEKALRDTNARLESEVRRRTSELSQLNRDLQTDIDMRVKAERALREREELYRRLVETSPDAILLSELDGTLTMANGAAFDLLDLTPAAVAAGKTCHELVVPEERAMFRLRRDENVRDGDPMAIECRFLKADGTTFVGESRSTAVGSGADEADRPGKVISIIRDITARRREEEEAFRAQKLESLGLLAGGIAHDFNNALTGIVGALALVRMSVKAHPALRDVLANAEDAAMRATGLTKQLLTFSRGGEPVKRPSSIPEIINNALRFCLAGSCVTWATHFEEDLAPLLVDRGQIDQVMNNLIINAMQAMSGEGRVEIDAEYVVVGKDNPVENLREGTYVQVTVRDTGPGILPDVQGRIFDPYFTTKSDGNGLGLTVSYSIIRRHGGTLRCDSPRGQGTAFSFYLPAECGSSASLAHKAEAAVRPGTRVLILDDDPAVQGVIVTLLESVGCHATATASSSEAVKLYRLALERRERFDAVLLDLTIRGGEGGRETIQRLRTIDPQVRAAVISGYSNDPVMANYVEHGFEAALAKPFRANDLIETVSLLAGPPVRM